MIVAASWVLALMTNISEPQSTQYMFWLPKEARESKASATVRYEDIAKAISEVAESREEAVHLVVRSWFESGWRRDVDLGYKRGSGVDSCIMQVRVLPGMKTPEGWTWQDLVTDRKKCVRAGARVLRYSLQTCVAMPENDRLSAYISGRCHSVVGRVASRKHMTYFRKLLTVSSKIKNKPDS